MTVDREALIVERWRGHQVTYVSRGAWFAGPRRRRAALHTGFRGLVVHHTVSLIPDYDQDQDVIGDLHDIGRFMRYLEGEARPDLGEDVPYSFVVPEADDPDEAIVCEGAGFGRVGAHTVDELVSPRQNLNFSRYGVALPGNTSDRAPTDGQIAGIQWIGSQLHDLATVVPTTGHRDHKVTHCPGDGLYSRLDEIQPDAFVRSRRSSMLVIPSSAARVSGSGPSARVIVPLMGEADGMDRAYWSRVAANASATGLAAFDPQNPDATAWPALEAAMKAQGTHVSQTGIEELAGELVEGPAVLTKAEVRAAVREELDRTRLRG